MTVEASSSCSTSADVPRPGSPSAGPSSSSPSSPRADLLSFGNLLLDYVVLLSPAEHSRWIDRFSLTPHVGQEMDTVGSGLLKEVQRTDPSSVHVSPGGCALNTCRVLKHCRPDRTVVFCGSVGGSAAEADIRDGGGDDDDMDARGRRLAELVRRDGVQVCLARQPGLPTGHSVGLADTAAERTLCANLGAAAIFAPEDLAVVPASSDADAADADALSAARLVYVEGYFASHSWPAVRGIGERRGRRKRKSQTRSDGDDDDLGLVFNLNGEYVCREPEFVENVAAMLKDGHIQVLFGNRDEFGTFRDAALQTKKHESLGRALSRVLDDVIDVSASFNDVTEHTNDVTEHSDDVTVVITNGPSSITTFRLTPAPSSHAVSGKRSFTVPALPREEIRDTVGAGDSFVAGFLQARLDLASLDDCVAAGIEASHMMLSQPGVSLPPTTPVER